MDELLRDLAYQGCWPCVIRRSNTVWRAHVNATGNWWAEATTPFEALRRATKAWERAGKPMDGMAAMAKMQTGDTA